MCRVRVVSVGREVSVDGEEGADGEVAYRAGPYKHSGNPASLAPPGVEGARRQGEVTKRTNLNHQATSEFVGIPFDFPSDISTTD